MPKKKPDPKIPLLTIRNTPVILDADLAMLYGVETKRLNEQIRRNRQRFPEDFMFQLTKEEWDNLKCQLGTSSTQTADNKKGTILKSQFATSSSTHGGRRTRPYAFTEHGALMAANVLNSKEAVAMSVYIIRAFVKQREALTANQAILKRLAEIDRTLLEHDTLLSEIYQQLLPLLQPGPEKKKPFIGFTLKEPAKKYRARKK
ncbi:MAG: ORF6N domain-containing protein [Verrucomicrobiota bacterium]